MSKIYSFYGGIHDASVCYFENGNLKIALQEERISRVKEGDGEYSFPLFSFRKIQEETGVSIHEADYVVTSTPTLYPYISEHLKGVQVREFPHHECHAVSTYFTSGFTGKCIMISYDGGGDGNYGDVWICEDGNMEKVLSMPSYSFGSLANLWTCATSVLGWKPHQDEGKVMGMSANGYRDPFVHKVLSQIISYKRGDDLKISNPGTDLLASYALSYLKGEGFLDSKEGRENFARCVQDLTEEIMVNFILDLSEKFPEYSKKIGLSGGLFHNVKMNQKINEIPTIDEIYVVPVMGDEGISFGAGLCMLKKLGHLKLPNKFDNCFFGLEYTDDEFITSIDPNEFNVSKFDLDEVASFLNTGHIVGLFNGKFEFGARALGSRSILVSPTDPGMHKKLNDRLKRNQVMPFAPAVLEEYSDELFEFGEKSKYSAEFMTICYTVKKEWQEKIQACFHREDKTARPQLVRKETNRFFWEIINAFRNLSGIPALLNTSFNGHGEPIVNSPDQALAHLRDGTIDVLITNGLIIRKKYTWDLI